MTEMAKAKEKWDAEDQNKPDGPDETDALLSKAIEVAIAQGKGWSPGEREAYLERILDDDFIPPIFASSEEEVEKSGLADAFKSLMYDDEPPAKLVLDFKKKGNDAFLNGKKNVAKNVQYYRDAINHYYEAYAWAERVEPVKSNKKTNASDESNAEIEEEEEMLTFTKTELEEMMSTLCSNAAMAHMQLKNWGHVRDESTKALQHNKNNVKAWYRLAKAHQMLKNWEEAGDAIDSGLAIEETNNELKKLQSHLADKVRKARLERQRRERARAERVAKVKEVWKYCKEKRIQLGRVPLVSTVKDDEDQIDDGGTDESRWHQHHPHTGRLPRRSPTHEGEWVWPCMFVYPTHGQSDFVNDFAESEMLALRMADVLPEPEDDGKSETAMPWDYNNEFRCSNLAVYFEVHCMENEKIVHPEYVTRLHDQGEAMRFYESSRALLGDEGPEIANVARYAERKLLHKQRKAWKKEHGSLWAKPDPCPVVRVHPAMMLRDILTDERMVVPNFLITFLMLPMEHPAHKKFLNEHKCVGVLQPKDLRN